MVGRLCPHCALCTPACAPQPPIPVSKGRAAYSHRFLVELNVMLLPGLRQGPGRPLMGPLWVGPGAGSQPLVPGSGL